MSEKQAPTIFESELRALTPELFKEAEETVAKVVAERTGRESPADREQRRKLANMTDQEFERHKRDIMAR